MDDKSITQQLTLAQQKARFDLWVKEDRIPNIRRKHHWKTWLRALEMTEQDERMVKNVRAVAWECKVVSSGDGTDDLMIELPAELMARLGWGVGDQVADG